MTSILSPISYQYYWNDFEKKKSGGIDTRTPFEGGKALDDRTLEDERDGICDETLIGNTHSPCNLEMTSILKILGYRTLDENRNDEIYDEKSLIGSDGTYDETLDDNIHDPCNLSPLNPWKSENKNDPYNFFPWNPWMILWISPLNDEM